MLWSFNFSILKSGTLPSHLPFSIPFYISFSSYAVLWLCKIQLALTLQVGHLPSEIAWYLTPSQILLIFFSYSISCRSELSHLKTQTHCKYKLINERQWTSHSWLCVSWNIGAILSNPQELHSIESIFEMWCFQYTSNHTTYIKVLSIY